MYVNTAEQKNGDDLEESKGMDGEIDGKIGR